MLNSFIAKKLRLAFFAAFSALVIICIALGNRQFQLKFTELMQQEFQQEQASISEFNDAFNSERMTLTTQGRLLSTIFETSAKADSQELIETPVYQVNLVNAQVADRLSHAPNAVVQQNYQLLKSSLDSLSKLANVEQAFFAWRDNSETFQLFSERAEFELPNKVLTWLALYSHQSNKLLDKPFFSPPFHIAKTDSNNNYMIYSFAAGQQQYFVMLELKLNALKLGEKLATNANVVLWHSDSGFLVSSNIEAQINRYVLTTNPLLAVSSLPLSIQKFIIYQSPERTEQVQQAEVANELQLVTKMELAAGSYKVLLFKPAQDIMSAAIEHTYQFILLIFLSGLLTLLIAMTLVIRLLASPTSKLINFIEQQSSVFEVSTPIVPKGWYAWFEKIQSSFQDNRNLLHNLTEKNKELDDKVKARTRELIQQTMSKDRNLALNRAMMNTIPDSLYYKNLSGGYLGCNNAYEKLIGLTEDQLVAKTAADIFEPEKALMIEQAERELIASNKVHIEQEVLRADNGETILIRWLYSPITNTKGEVLGILGLGQDITEQQTSIRNLSFAAEQAEKANQVKGEFIANISHEIRTPMNSIIGMLQLLQGSAVDSSQQSYIKIAETSAQNLLSVINNILDFSKASAEKLEVELEPFSITQVLESSFANSLPKAMQKGILLDIQLPSNFPEYLQGDEVKLGQIFTNLIGNAVKFTEQGQVTVTGEVVEQSESSEKLCFYIRDTGIGIEEEQQKRVFEAFSQADNSVTRKYGGTGLGLTITCQLVELLNGSIELESQVGVGTVFKLTFEFTRVLQQPELKAIDAQWFCWDSEGDVSQLLLDKLNSYGLQSKLLTSAGNLQPDSNNILVCRPEAINSLSDEIIEQIHQQKIKLQPVCFSYSVDSSKLAQLPHLPMLTAPFSVKRIISNAAEQKLLLPKPPQQKTEELAGVKLLVVEDNKVNQQVLTLMLQSEGAKVVVANNGVEALALIDDDCFDMVITDIQMPVMDGITLVKKLRENSSGVKNIPIVVVSAHTGENDINNSIAAGADKHLAKPIDKLQLFDTLADLLTTSRQQLIEKLGQQINVEFLLQQFNQSVPIAIQVLQRFVQSQQQEFVEFCQQAQKLELDSVKAKVHSYKGMLGNIGAEAAHQACIELERNLNTNNKLTSEELLVWQQNVSQVFDSIAIL